MSKTIRRKVLGAAATAIVLAGAVVSTGTAHAFQSDGVIAIRIAGPAVTYQVDGCPGPDQTPDGHSVSFSTARPDGTSSSGNGLQVSDRSFTLTTDIRSDNPDGSYTVTASCLDAELAAVSTFGSATFWVVEGMPSLEAPAETPAPESTETPVEDTEDAEGADPGTDDGATAQTEADPTPAGDDDDGSVDTEAEAEAAQPEASPTPDDTSADDSDSADAATPEPSATGSAMTTVQVDRATVSGLQVVTTWVDGCPAAVDGVASAVEFRVTDPGGNAKAVASRAPDGDNAFSAAISVPELPVIGKYTVDAACGVYEGDSFVARRAYNPAQFDVVTSVGLESGGGDGQAATADPGAAQPAPTAEPSERRDPSAQATAAVQAIPAQPQIAFTG